MIDVTNYPQYSQRPLLGKIVIASNLVVETGLHIGGGGANLDIGGLDKPVIRDPLTKRPYLPGSSLKGKLRSILERLYNKPLNRSGGSGVRRYESDDLEDGYTEISEDQLIRYAGAKECLISRVFGSTGSKCWVLEELKEREDLEIIDSEPKTINGKPHIYIKGRNFPARLIIRDCHIKESSFKELREADTGLYLTEWKFENSIDRITAAANPRQFERVPAGSKFKFELVYTVEDLKQAQEDLTNLAIALAILEDDALGGHGSRGYGKIRFEKFQIDYRTIAHYKKVKDKNNLLKDIGENTQDLLTTLSSSDWLKISPGDSND
jgi:CRISPR-associated protein Csm3